VIEGKRGFGCSGWKEGCPFVLWREYRGCPLNVGQIRELLQWRVLLRPVVLGGADHVILQLSDSGALLEIPVPREKPRPVGNARRSEPASGEAPATEPDRNAAAQGPGARGPTAGKTGGPLGPCPLCGSQVVERECSYGCSGWRSGCKFAIWKTVAGKRLSAATARTLLRRGRSPLLRGFRSKSGKPFSARLKLEGGAVRFDFEP
jgi:DNA topoisomerase-3